MNENLFRTILKRYEAEIEDAHYKIDAICEHNLVIPEHVDITGEVDSNWNASLVQKTSWQQ